MSDNLQGAIDAYLLTFDADVIHMTPRLTDNWFPPRFIEFFEKIFEAKYAGEWTIVNDPKLTLPKHIMEQLFQTEKQNMIQANLDRMRASRER